MPAPPRPFAASCARRRCPWPCWPGVITSVRPRCASGDDGRNDADRSHRPHRLIPPRHPQTNGRVERRNGRISEVLATRRCRSGEHLAATLRCSVDVYNHHLPQRALGHVSPHEALQQW
ncbi:MAG: integrase core domain-containing protein [Chromatiaceae bacterium]|nr:integrase core domain-containing protein [Chromatiaceae bacterium]